MTPKMRKRQKVTKRRALKPGEVLGKTSPSMSEL